MVYHTRPAGNLAYSQYLKLLVAWLEMKIQEMTFTLSKGTHRLCVDVGQAANKSPLLLASSENPIREIGAEAYSRQSRPTLAAQFICRGRKAKATSPFSPHVLVVLTFSFPAPGYHLGHQTCWCLHGSRRQCPSKARRTSNEKMSENS